MISENSYCDEGPVTSGKFLTSAAADASLSYGSWFPFPVSYRRISRPARPAWPCRRCPRARPWSRWRRRRRGGTHSLMHGMEAGLGALFAGDREGSASCHCTRRRRTRTTRRERRRRRERERGRGRERVKPTSRGKNAAEMQGLPKKVCQ